MFTRLTSQKCIGKFDQRYIDYQRILWSASPSEPPKNYQLLTITYGTAVATFLALRVIKQLILDEGSTFPLVMSILCDKIYVDDVLFGENEISLLCQARNQLRELLSSEEFALRKWASNSTELLSDRDSNNHEF